jgi:hypothetical protein
MNKPADVAYQIEIATIKLRIDCKTISPATIILRRLHHFLFPKSMIDPCALANEAHWVRPASLLRRRRLIPILIFVLRIHNVGEMAPQTACR